MIPLHHFRYINLLDMGRFLVQSLLGNGLDRLLLVDVYSISSPLWRWQRLVSEEFPLANLRVSVTGDQDGVYQDQVLSLSGNEPMKPTLLLIGKRLGHDNVNPLYYNSLKVSLPTNRYPLKFILIIEVGPPWTSTIHWYSRRSSLIITLLLRKPRRLFFLPRSTPSPSRSPLP